MIYLTQAKLSEVESDHERLKVMTKQKDKDIEELKMVVCFFSYLSLDSLNEVFLLTIFFTTVALFE